MTKAQLATYAKTLLEGDTKIRELTDNPYEKSSTVDLALSAGIYNNTFVIAQCCLSIIEALAEDQPPV